MAIIHKWLDREAATEAAKVLVQNGMSIDAACETVFGDIAYYKYRRNNQYRRIPSFIKEAQSELLVFSKLCSK